MGNNEKKLYDVILQVRFCFNHLKMLGEKLSSDLGINPSMRAVMEALNNADRLTVPDIAKNKGVSRQHIQNIMNSLLEGDFVSTLDNPAHKRSQLYELTLKGRHAFTVIREREKEPLQRLADKIDPEKLDMAKQTLADLNSRIVAEINHGDSNEHQ